jgi:hypothetical protein
MLYTLSRQWLPGWRATVAPLIWLLNPPLLSQYLTGKENAVYAFLLLFSAGLVAGQLTRPLRPRAAVTTGIVIGLMVLSRVNALASAALFLAVLLVLGGGMRRTRVERAALTLLGLAVVVVPWGMYAWGSFGTILPTSGSAKLLGSWAAVAVLVNRHISWLPLDRLAGLLPASERLFLANPGALVLPTRALAESLFVAYLPDLVMGFLGPSGTPALPYMLRLLLLAAAWLGVGTWTLVVVLQRMHSQKLAARSLPLRSRDAGAAVLLGLLLAAALNGLSNWLLLPAYLFWGLWYAVPEEIAWALVGSTVLGCALGLAEAGLLGGTRRALGRHPGAPRMARRAVTALSAVLGGLVVALLVFRSSREWRPVGYQVMPDRTQEEVYQGVRWMNQHLPAGARAGSYSAGLLGYFAEGYTVVNLDGLANTPEFVQGELKGHLLFLRGLATEDPMVAYLDTAGIGFLANYDPTDRIAKGPYLGLAPSDRAELLYVGQGLIDWRDGQLRRFLVARIGP